MPVPSSINDIFTTAGSNPPGGGETPAEGDNHIRAAYSFIAALRDILNGTSSTTAAVQTLIVSGAATFNGNVTLGSDGSDALTINAATNIAGTLTAQSTATFEDVVTFDAVPAGKVTSGTYTPILTNAGNISASTAYVNQYIRVGDVATVSGAADVTVTSGVTATTLYVSLPFASALAAGDGLGGAGSFEPATGSAAATAAYVEAEPVNDLALIRWTPSTGGSRTLRYTFTYRII